jgi:Holliday junction resolvasome RuvABC endonuclease subunit
MDTQPDNIWRYCTDAVAGIDWSKRSPAICIIPPSAHINNIIVPFDHCHFYWLTHRQGLAYDEHNMHGTYMGEGTSYASMAQWAVSALKSHNCQYTGLEDYAYNSPHVHTLVELAENGGILKWHLHEAGLAYDLFSPTSIKKFACSDGRAKKDDMMEAFVEDTEVCLNVMFGRKPEASSKSPVSDLIDAYYIALAARADLNQTNYNYERKRNEETKRDTGHNSV